MVALQLWRKGNSLRSVQNIASEVKVIEDGEEGYFSTNNKKRTKVND